MLNRQDVTPHSWPQSAAKQTRWTLLTLCALAGWLYLALIPWHSLDADHWFVPWLEHMRLHGSWRSLGQPMQVQTDGVAGAANYNPPYLYLLALTNLLSPALDALATVKIVAVAGTLFCSICVFVLCRQFLPRARAGIAAGTFLILPTAVLNGPGWGQTDAIYSGFLLLCVTAAVTGHCAAMMLAFGAAAAFKLPAVFLVPFVAALVLSGRVPSGLLTLAALAYALTLIPAWLAGQSLHDLLWVYFDQAGTYHWLSMKAPNPWAVVQYLQLVSYAPGVLAGTVLAALAAGALTLFGIRRRPSGDALLLFSTACVIVLPFLLPKMHDRYFFPADALSFCYAAARPNVYSVATAACVQAGSLLAYASILAGLRAGPIVGSALMATALVLVIRQMTAIRTPR